MDKRFDCLDSWRGTLVLSVIFSHTKELGFRSIGCHMGVMGFFSLSSFLLTYRLIKQYENANLKDIIKYTINYAITKYFVYIFHMLFSDLLISYILRALLLHHKIP
jgi:peptidoglycan/LPS O-acetylase OafA/YrhL